MEKSKLWETQSSENKYGLIQKLPDIARCPLGNPILSTQKNMDNRITSNWHVCKFLIRAQVENSLSGLEREQNKASINYFSSIFEQSCSKTERKLRVYHFKIYLTLFHMVKLFFRKNGPI